MLGTNRSDAAGATTELTPRRGRAAAAGAAPPAAAAPPPSVARPRTRSARPRGTAARPCRRRRSRGPVAPRQLAQRQREDRSSHRANHERQTGPRVAHGGGAVEGAVAAPEVAHRAAGAALLLLRPVVVAVVPVAQPALVAARPRAVLRRRHPLGEGHQRGISARQTGGGAPAGEAAADRATLRAEPGGHASSREPGGRRLDRDRDRDRNKSPGEGTRAGAEGV